MHVDLVSWVSSCDKLCVRDQCRQHDWLEYHSIGRRLRRIGHNADYRRRLKQLLHCVVGLKHLCRMLVDTGRRCSSSDRAGDSVCSGGHTDVGVQLRRSGAFFLPSPHVNGSCRLSIAEDNVSQRFRAAPVVSFTSESNAVPSTGWSVTVAGLGFGIQNATPAARLGTSSCVTLAWA